MSTIKRPKVFLDSGDPAETIKAKAILGTIDGQTTNPSLISKNPEAASYLQKGKKLTEKELLNLYKQVVHEIQKEIAGPISVEVYADWDTKANSMLKQAEEMNSWGKHVYIKFPTIPEGLKAANEFVQKGGKVNMTLVFNQQQAAAVYTATIRNSPVSADEKFHAHFVSPFIGRWDDRGYKGLELIKNIVKMYKKFDKLRNIKKSHVHVLSASIRTLEHLYGAIVLGTDIITIPLKTIQEWIHAEEWMPDTTYRIEAEGLKPLVYQDLPLRKEYTDYRVEREKGSLVDEGLMKFVNDWKKLLLPAKSDK